jgi:hypothetical protein
MKVIDSVKLILIIFCLYDSCYAQNLDIQCNRKSINSNIEKKIPQSVCIPNSYTISFVQSDMDLNDDGKNDLILRYENHPCMDGDSSFYSIYLYKNDSIYSLIKTLSNISTPYIKSLSSSYLEKNPLANSIVKEYPCDAEISFSKDIITIEHLIPDYYGKTYYFKYSNSFHDWYLMKIRYWIGKLPTWMINQYNLDEKLYQKVYLNEDKEPNGIIYLSKFDLKASKIKANEESSYFMNKYDIFSWQKLNSK